MEQQQALGQLAIVHLVKQRVHYLLSLCINTCQTNQLGIECEILQVTQKLLNEGSLFAGLQILEQVLEHTAGRTGRRHKLQYCVIALKIRLPFLKIGFFFRQFRLHDSFT